MKIIRERISKDELAGIAEKQFGSLVKAVVDVGRGMAAVGGELHADEEALLLADGSRQEDPWGINLYPEKPMAEMRIRTWWRSASIYAKIFPWIESRLSKS